MNALMSNASFFEQIRENMKELDRLAKMQEAQVRSLQARVAEMAYRPVSEEADLKKTVVAPSVANLPGLGPIFVLRTLRRSRLRSRVTLLLKNFVRIVVRRLLTCRTMSCV